MTEFEWDDDKAAENLRKHQVDFRIAKFIFDDPHLQIRQDIFAGEERWQAFGRVQNSPVLLVVYTTHDVTQTEVIRIISARRASRKEARIYAGKDDSF